MIDTGFLSKGFTTIVHNGVELLVYEPWINAGVVHGMTTAALDFSRGSFEETWRVFQDAFELDALAIPDQCHGVDAIDLRTREATACMLESSPDLVRRQRADAIVAPAVQLMQDQRIGYGVVTADCVPILVRTPSAWGVVHAGWRGLADGILEQTLRLLDIGAGEGEAVILACAGASAYEVGEDVITALGSCAVYRTGQSKGKFLLDLAASARVRIESYRPGFSVHAAGICTISDPSFHSFRRDGERAGRSLSFVIPQVDGSGL